MSRSKISALLTGRTEHRRLNDAREAAMPSPRYPSLFQVNTRVRLGELARELGRPATLDDVPDAEWRSGGSSRSSRPR